jgi:hypothetical protein
MTVISAIFARHYHVYVSQTVVIKIYLCNLLECDALHFDTTVCVIVNEDRERLFTFLQKINQNCVGRKV